MAISTKLLSEQDVMTNPVSLSLPKSGIAIDLYQIFRLIDQTLAFEICLFYQVLPLMLEGQCLTLGMVRPDDPAPLQYISHIMGTDAYLLRPTPLPVGTYHQILSAYLRLHHPPIPLRSVHSDDRDRVPQRATVPSPEATPLPSQGAIPSPSPAPKVIAFDLDQETLVLGLEETEQQELEKLEKQALRLSRQLQDTLYAIEKYSSGRSINSGQQRKHLRILGHSLREVLTGFKALWQKTQA